MTELMNNAPTQKNSQTRPRGKYINKISKNTHRKLGLSHETAAFSPPIQRRATLPASQPDLKGSVPSAQVSTGVTQTDTTR